MNQNNITAILYYILTLISTAEFCQIRTADLLWIPQTENILSDAYSM